MVTSHHYYFYHGRKALCLLRKMAGETGLEPATYGFGVFRL